MSWSPPHSIRKHLVSFKKIWGVLYIVTMPNKWPTVFTIQKVSHSIKDPEDCSIRCSITDYYSVFPLPHWSLRYRTFLLTLFQAGLMWLCSNTKPRCHLYISQAKMLFQAFSSGDHMIKSLGILSHTLRWREVLAILNSDYSCISTEQFGQQEV